MKLINKTEKLIRVKNIIPKEIYDLIVSNEIVFSKEYFLGNLKSEENFIINYYFERASVNGKCECKICICSNKDILFKESIYIDCSYMNYSCKNKIVAMINDYFSKIEVEYNDIIYNFCIRTFINTDFSNIDCFNESKSKNAVFNRDILVDTIMYKFKSVKKEEIIYTELIGMEFSTGFDLILGILNMVASVVNEGNSKFYPTIEISKRCLDLFNKKLYHIGYDFSEITERECKDLIEYEDKFDIKNLEEAIQLLMIILKISTEFSYFEDLYKYCDERISLEDIQEKAQVIAIQASFFYVNGQKF